MEVITIGCDTSNDVVINDTLVSKHHLQIIQDDFGNFRLNDFGSSNGTFVNGQKITGEITLNVSDIVRIGNTTLSWNSYFKTKTDTDISQKKQRHDIRSGRKTKEMTKSLIVLVSLCLVVLLYYFFCKYKQEQGGKYAETINAMCPIKGRENLYIKNCYPYYYPWYTNSMMLEYTCELRGGYGYSGKSVSDSLEESEKQIMITVLKKEYPDAKKYWNRFTYENENGGFYFIWQLLLMILNN